MLIYIIIMLILFNFHSNGALCVETDPYRNMAMLNVSKILASSLFALSIENEQN